MATKGTINSEKFLALYHKYDNGKTDLVPCSGLAEIIEKNDMSEVDKYLDEHLKEYKGVNNVVLGCTHYPLIKNNIRKVLGDVNFFDGSNGVSRELLRQLKLREINYINSDRLQIEFIDSSNDISKEKRFKELIKNSK